MRRYLHIRGRSFVAAAFSYCHPERSARGGNRDLVQKEEKKRIHFPFGVNQLKLSKNRFSKTTKKRLSHLPASGKEGAPDPKKGEKGYFY